jgi:hypothetical protein
MEKILVIWGSNMVSIVDPYENRLGNDENLIRLHDFNKIKFLTL